MVYHREGIGPATRIGTGAGARETTATALLPAIATYSVRPSGARARPFGSLPTGAREGGPSATVSCSITLPVARSSRATPLAPASAAHSSRPRTASAEGGGPTDRAGGRAGGRAVRSR